MLRVDYQTINHFLTHHNLTLQQVSSLWTEDSTEWHGTRWLQEVSKLLNIPVGDMTYIVSNCMYVPELKDLVERKKQ